MTVRSLDVAAAAHVVRHFLLSLQLPHQESIDIVPGQSRIQRRGYLLTRGCRLDEIEGLLKTEVDGAGMALRLGDTKTGKSIRDAATSPRARACRICTRAGCLLWMWLLDPALRESAYSTSRTRVTRTTCGRRRCEETHPPIRCGSSLMACDTLKWPSLNS